MSVEFQGGMNGEGLRIGIVVATFNEFITSKLLDGAQAALARHGVRDDDVSVASVPGSFELPLVAKRLAESGQHDAVICLGAVIRGETDQGIANVGLSSGVPVIFGVLTTDTLEQAINRAGGKQGNNGYGAGLAAIEMANLMRALDTR